MEKLILKQTARHTHMQIKDVAANEKFYLQIKQYMQIRNCVCKLKILPAN